MWEFNGPMTRKGAIFILVVIVLALIWNFYWRVFL